jgi:hypothetical protein
MLFITIGMIVMAIAAPAWGQETRGRINITVLDPQQAVVQGAALELVDLATNEVRNATTTTAGTYTFPNLSVGKYKLTVSAKGFRNTVYDEVTVSATKATDIVTPLQVGAPNEVITVEAATPVLQTTAVAIGSTIDVKNIGTLPLVGRDIGQFTRYVPGYTGTWNGLPSAAQGNNIDGVISSTSRMKFSGNSAPSVSVRLENIEEMTVQTDQLDQNQGFGMAVMQVNYTTKRGTNTWHGSVYEDLRNDFLNANTWSNNARGVTRARLKLNDFGGNVGGPVFKDKLFFFFSLATSRQPGTTTRGATVLNPAGQAGNYTYVGTDGLNHTINVFQVAKAYDPALAGATNSVMGAQLSLINSAIAGAISTPNTDLLTNAISWQTPNPDVRWFPTFRVDYTPASKWRISLTANQTKRRSPTSGSPLFPGQEFIDRVGGFRSNNISTSLGIDWTATNTMLNAFRFGYLYPAVWNGDTSYDWGLHPEIVNWPLVTSSMQYSYPIPTFYPVFTIADTVNWQKGKHGLNFGFSAYREQDKYWNGAEPTRVNIGMDSGDPAYNALTNAGTYQPLPFASTSQQGSARSLYALLTARISYITGMYKYDKASGQYIQKPLGHFDLNELAKAGGLFVQDSWRFRPNLTINMGFRWDFTAASTDLNGLYHSATTSSIWGPSGVGNLFKPGTLTGNMNPTIDEIANPYNSWYVTPQPSLGIAWSPKFGEGFLKRILGQGNTVIRTSFSYRNYSVPYQYFWNNATDYGSFYYQFYTATARNSTAPGSFAPGSLSLGQTYPSFSYDPPSYMKSIPAGNFTFNNSSQGNGINGMDHNIHQPYTMSWTIGIQQKLGQSRAIEIRYNGNKSVHQWMSLNINEVNVFENGFLQEFKNAQKNLAINAANGVTPLSFANLYPAQGTVALPILTGAFTGDKNGSQTGSSFRNSSFITNLNTGAVGSLANTLTTYGSVPYFCNLVGSSFAPCARMGYTGAGAGYAINFFQANPYGSGIPVTVMTDPGWATYNGLQIEFRQQYWHGMQFNANYTYSKGLGVTLGTDWTGAYTSYTLRNLKESYGPNGSDIRHVANISGSADLPLGAGKMFLNQQGPLDRIFGGWNVGTIITIRSGSMGRITGGYSTFNNLADGGVVLNGITREDLQNAVGVYKTSANYVQTIDPKFRTTGVGANTAYITANTTPGTYVGAFYIYGPGSWECDLSLNKSTVITERTRINFQTQFLNVFNHPTFRGMPSGSVRGSGWATSTGQSNTNSGFGRIIEFRVSISF